VASPIYNPSWAGGRSCGYVSSRRWGVVKRAGSWFRGRTPQYTGSGQPAPDSGGSIGSGTPAYLAAPPPMSATQNAATTPQPNPAAIVVPRR
jgi:hypothetical protein